MSRMRVAVVGGGVSGLTAAYILAKEGVEVVVYEKEGTLGSSGKTATIDLDFMLFTQVMYPDVMEFLESLGVDMEPTDISFSVSLDEGHGSEWGTRNGLSSLFAQKTNILNPWFWKMIREITKFKDDASNYLEELENHPDIDRNETLGHFVQSHGYSDLFQKAFLVLGYPQRVTPRWRSQRYVNNIKKELESLGCQVRTDSEVYSVLTNDEGCAIIWKDGMEEAFDGCIISVHAPDALNILGKQATYDELRILGAFQYASSDVVIHHDSNLMPKNPVIWGSRNFIQHINDKAYVTYWLNNVQNISDPGIPFFLTLNPPHTPKNTLCKWSTSCPIPLVSAYKASSELSIIQGKRRLWFCGAYQGHGLPEDAVKAAILAANGLLNKNIKAIHENPKSMVPSFLETGARILVTSFVEEGGMVVRFEGTRKKSTLNVTLRVHKPQFYWKIATEGDIGFADAYINGDFSFVDKNEGLVNFFLIIISSTEVNNYTSKLNKKRGWWTPLLYTSIIASAKYFVKNVSRKNRLSQARQNISKHYDLSNELFSLFLDETMAYSCAIFQTPGEDLKTAQLRKVHILIEKAKISKEHHILEIGFGWGNFALEVVKKTGCKYTGITLSENQLQYVELKVKEAGLQDRIDLLLCDYRQLPNNYKYDRIISCEVLEHVGHEYVEEFFKCCESALAKNGLFVIQFSSVADGKYDETRLSEGFLREYIFPGGYAASLSRVTSAMAAASRLSVVHLEEIGNNYFDTLKHWRKNFLQNQGQIMALGFDEKFIRTWEYYFDYCAAGFKYCILGNYQIVFSRPGDVAAFGNNPYNPVPSAC